MLRKHFIAWMTLILLYTACSPAGSPAADSPEPNLTPTPDLPPPTLTVPPPTPTATSTQIPPTPTDQPACRDAALFLEDVTIADNSKVEADRPFVKTWRLQNTGTCTWNSRYLLTFSGGERMAAPDTTPLAETPPGSTLDISVELLAPPADGFYSGLFAIRNPAGQPVPIGALSSMWVKIRVGNVVAVQPPASSGSAPAATSPASGGSASSARPAGGGIENCQFSENPAYLNQLAALINAERADAGLPALALDSQLSKAARNHSLDMACNNFLSHSGSNGSWIGDRLATVGVNTYNYTEIIAIGTPQDAMNQWRGDGPHWQAVLDPNATRFGIGYIYVANSDFGGYWTVDLVD